MCPSGESHVPEGELLGNKGEQGKRVRRRAGEYEARFMGILHAAGEQEEKRPLGSAGGPART